jgi:hypothetical protein
MFNSKNNKPFFKRIEINVDEKQELLQKDRTFKVRLRLTRFGRDA